MSPIIRKDKVVEDVVGRLAIVKRAYRNGKRVYHYNAPYNPIGMVGFTSQSNDNIVRLMNPVEDVRIS